MGFMCNVVLEYGGDVFLRCHWSAQEAELKLTGTNSYLRKIALTIAYEETGLAATTVTNYDKFFGKGWWLGNICVG